MKHLSSLSYRVPGLTLAFLSSRGWTSKLLAGVVLASAALAGLTLPSQALAQPQPAASDTAAAKAALARNVKGLWVWRETSINTPQARQELLTFARTHGF